MKSQYEESGKLTQGYIDVALTAGSCKVTSQPLGLPLPLRQSALGRAGETSTD